MKESPAASPAETGAAIRSAARAEACLSENFVVLTLASCAIATFGLLENSVAVIIGAMIIAPLMNPIVAFAYGALAGDFALTRRALATTAVGASIAVATSTGLGALVTISSFGSEIVGRTRPNLLDLAIAIAAGTIAGFVRVRPALSNTLAGTAIAVALMPPLCVVGLTLSHREFSLALGALLLFGTNFLGIAVACMLVYVVWRGVRSHNRPAILVTIGVTIALLFPLGASTYELVRESHIESQIRQELTTNTVTFRHIALSAASFDWYERPVLVHLTVQSADPVTPSQVVDLQTFVAKRTGQAIRLVVDVNRYSVVTAP